MEYVYYENNFNQIVHNFKKRTREDALEEIIEAIKKMLNEDEMTKKEKEINNRAIDNCLKVLDEVMDSKSLIYKVLKREFNDLKEK